MHSLHLSLLQDGDTVLTRIFHGLHASGKEIRYFKPSELKNGALWKDSFVDPKTKQRRFYTLYGGKIAGILTQSFCRELFFNSLREVARWAQNVPNVDLLGQFHDEIVLDWVPPKGYCWPDVDQAEAMYQFEKSMTRTSFRNFPLAAEVKAAHRYIK